MTAMIGLARKIPARLHALLPLSGAITILALGLALLGWNETRALGQSTGTGAAIASAVHIDVNRIDPANEGHLVFATGTAGSSGRIFDDELDISFTDAIAVRREVEMFQWVESTTGAHASADYSQAWSGKRNDASSFRRAAGHVNPPMKISGTDWTADSTRLGSFEIGSAAALLLRDAQAVQPPSVPRGWIRRGDYLVLSTDPQTPRLGDLRVRYFIVKSGTQVSVLARQSGDRFAPYRLRDGTDLFALRQGKLEGERLVAGDNHASQASLWILRAISALMIWCGILLSIKPLATMSTAPLHPSVAAPAPRALAAFTVALPLASLIAAATWLFDSPVQAALLILGSLAVSALAGRTASTIPG